MSAWRSLGRPFRRLLARRSKSWGGGFRPGSRVPGRIRNWALSLSRASSAVAVGSGLGSKWQRLSPRIWASVHLGMLALVALLSSVVATRVLLVPGADPGPLPNFFQHPPPPWKAAQGDSGPVRKPIDLGGATGLYTTGVGSDPTQVEVGYLSDGEGAASWFEQETKQAQPGRDRDQRVNGVGVCRFAAVDGRVGLWTCLDAQGIGATTDGEFELNRRRFDYRFSRLARWLIGLQPLQDRRCIVVFVSVPAPEAGPGSLPQGVPDALRSWREWWISGIGNPPPH